MGISIQNNFSIVKKKDNNGDNSDEDTNIPFKIEFRKYGIKRTKR
jgi:hypothetical protein